MMGDFHMMLGNYRKSERLYAEALGKSPEDAAVLRKLGELYSETGEYEKSFTYLERTYSAEPSFRPTKEAALIPEALMKMRRYEEALLWSDKILRETPGDSEAARGARRLGEEIGREMNLREL